MASILNTPVSQLTPEQQEEKRRYYREYYRTHPMSEYARNKHRDRAKAYAAAHRDAYREANKKWKESMTEEERRAFLDRRNARARELRRIAREARAREKVLSATQAALYKKEG